MQSDDEPAVYDLALGVRLAEATSQVWGTVWITQAVVWRERCMHCSSASPVAPIFV